MRTIKTYESFFNLSFLKRKNRSQHFPEVNINLTEVKEAFLELCDAGYDVKVLKTIPKENSKSGQIVVKISLENGRLFIINDIKETLEIALSYLKEEYNLILDRIESGKYYRIGGEYNLRKTLRTNNDLNNIDYPTSSLLTIYFK